MFDTVTKPHSVTIRQGKGVGESNQEIKEIERGSGSKQEDKTFALNIRWTTQTGIQTRARQDGVLTDSNGNNSEGIWEEEQQAHQYTTCDILVAPHTHTHTSTRAQTQTHRHSSASWEEAQERAMERLVSKCRENEYDRANRCAPM
jgi:UDP-2,3-diacylglucosamine pyrophosphatase LpxH